jgi:hypothetical protein
MSAPVGATLAGSFTFSDLAKHTADESVVMQQSLLIHQPQSLRQVMPVDVSLLQSLLIHQPQSLRQVMPVDALLQQSNTTSVDSTNTIVDGISIPQSNTTSVSSTNTIIDGISVLPGFSVLSQTAHVMTNASNLSQSVNLTSSEDMIIDVSGSLDINPSATTSVTAGLVASSTVGVNISTSVDDSVKFLSAANLLTNASISVADGMLYVDSVAFNSAHVFAGESNFLWARLSPTGGNEAEQIFIAAVMNELLKIVVDDMEVELLNIFLKEIVTGNLRGDLGQHRDIPAPYGEIDIRSWMVASGHYTYAEYSQTLVDRVISPAYENAALVTLYGLEHRQPKNIYGSTFFNPAGAGAATWGGSETTQNVWNEVEK